MLKIVKRLLILHRLAAFAKSLSLASSPVILAGCVVLMFHKKGWLAIPENYTISSILILAGLAWIPLYFRMRGSLLSVARQADDVLKAEGMVTAGADIFQAGARPSPWSGLIEQRGMQFLRSRDRGRVVPLRRLAHFITPVLAALIFALTCNYSALSAASKTLDWNDEAGIETQMRIFSPVDEKLLQRLHQKIREDLQAAPGHYSDAQLEKLRSELHKTLSTFPKSDEELAQYISKVEKLKKQVEKLEEAQKQEQEILQQMGEKIDGKLLDEMGKQLEQKDLEEAAKAAAELAENMEGKQPSEKSLEEAAQDLAEAAQEGEKKMGEKQKEDGLEGKEEKSPESGGKEGEKSQGGSGKEKGEGKGSGKDGEAMSPEKFEKLKNTLDKLNKLAEMFNIKSPDQIPKGLKDLAKEFSDSKLSNDQMKELKDLINKLDNLKNMMVEAKDGKGKGQYSDLMKDFENKASGGKSKEGQPGQKGQGQPGATPEGKEMKPGEGQGEGGTPMEIPGGTKGGQGKPGGPENPADAQAAAEKDDSKKKGQEGWGDAAAPHTGDPTAMADETMYDDMDVEGKDSTGPLKKDVIKGAAEKGFIGKDYKNVYEEYSSIIEEIMEEENVPSLYRYYVNKYFELIAPRE
jgi:predicted transcriptional regulator